MYTRYFISRIYKFDWNLLAMIAKFIIYLEILICISIFARNVNPDPKYKKSAMMLQVDSSKIREKMMSPKKRKQIVDCTIPGKNMR
jgi:hypothetical protein